MPKQIGNELAICHLADALKNLRTCQGIGVGVSIDHFIGVAAKKLGLGRDDYNHNHVRDLIRSLSR